MIPVHTLLIIMSTVENQAFDFGYSILNQIGQNCGNGHRVYDDLSQRVSRQSQ